MTKSIRGIILLILILTTNRIFSDTTVVGTGSVHFKEQLVERFLITQKWLYKNGDDLAYSKREFKDQDWDTIHSSLDENTVSKIGFKGKGWFRLHIIFDSAVANKSYIFSIFQTGASEIYFNGKLEKRIGNYGSKESERDNGVNDPLFFVPMPGQENVIAIRYENLEYEHSYNNTGQLVAGFSASITQAETYFDSVLSNLISASYLGMGIFSFFFSIGLIHFLLYIFYRSRKSNLLFSIFCFLFSYYFLHYFLVTTVLTEPTTTSLLAAFIVMTVPFFFLSLLSVLYSLFYDKPPKLQKYLLIASILCSVCLMFLQLVGYIIALLLILTTTVELIRVMIIANRKKKKGAIIISIGFGLFALLITVVLLVMITHRGSFQLVTGSLGEELFSILLFMAIASIPISMSTFLAWDFAQTNKSLSKKLIEVEELSAKTIEQEKERQKILSEQNEKLETQVKERTKEINEQKKVIEEKNKDITDSINYAQRIQRSILPTESEIKDIFKESFFLFKTRDIVSGDFYQFKKVGEYRFAILADCTGHGVPGALMSMIGSNLLNQIIVERKILEPNKILSELHKEVKSTLRQTSGVQSHDGMDATIVLLKGKKIYVASANRPVYIVQNGELTEIKPDKRSIGGSQSSNDIVFVETELSSKKGMMMYLFSDGYADQFGGDTGKKFKVKNLAELLLAIHEKPLEVQHEVLNTTFDRWRNLLEQVDDVSLIGIRF